ncbi:LysR family transcriptional regulator [Zavarzinia compransoris]|uniref:LysR family transcriptional regulator n=1 Tax=Zavarzinia marina TaxID=2911065 RepID=UPI001F25E669|nr:LysR family transcriptional regulator [Zavarzinia marina]MCF4167318.1 LysR family transcriptional regulator [Zavarzinia marina]
MAISTTVRHLRTLIAVAEAGSTAGAARALNLSQPSVSVALRELEAILGRDLFQRLPARGLVPTEFGLRKLAEARRLSALLAGFEAPVATDGGEVAGHVAFGYFSTLGPQYVPAVLRRMVARHPGVSVSIHEGDLDGLNRRVAAGRIELALTYDVEIGPGLAAETVGELRPYVLLPAGHRLAAQEAVTVGDLAAEPFVLVDLPLSREFLLSPFRAAGIEPRIAYRATSLEMVFGLVANGLGVSLLITRREGARAHDGWRVIRRPLAGSAMRQGVVIVGPADQPRTAPAEALAACIRAELAGA